MYHCSAGNISKGGRYIISVILEFCTIFGAIIGIVSFILYLLDRKRK